MGLFSRGSSALQVIASLAGQAVTALRYTATAPAGTDAFAATTAGARFRVGPGTVDYFTSDGNLTITAAGVLSAVSDLATAANVVMSGAAATLDIQGAGSGIYFSSQSANGGIDSNVSAANAGATPASAALKLYSQQALDATDWLVEFGTAANAASVFAVTYGGSIVVPSTDSSGTPGAAVINRATGRSASAAAASSVVITNSLVTAASHVFISPRTRDTTGLLPLVTTIGAGSFTVTTTAGCTANLVFDWWVLT